MSPLMEELRNSFSDEEYRYGYAETFLDTFVAAQIRTLREQREWEQEDLARRMGTKQSAISRLENVNYSSWSVSTLKRLARVFGVRLKISFEDFVSLLADVNNFDTQNLRRKSFNEDPAFQTRMPPAYLPLREARTDLPAPSLNQGGHSTDVLEDYMRNLSKKPPQSQTSLGGNSWKSLRSSSPAL